MRTTTLLCAVVAGAAAVVSAVAAEVYSVNAVGYVNTTLKPGFNLVSNPLDAGAGNNTVSKLLTGVPDGTTVYKYVGNTYVIDGYIAGVGWDDDNLALNPGEGFFVQLPGAANLTVTFVGEVPQGAASDSTLPAGFALVASKVPQAGKLQADLKYPAADGDTIYTFNNATSSYAIYSYLAALGGWDPEDPTIAVGQGFWSQRVAGAAWVRNFSVNP